MLLAGVIVKGFILVILPFLTHAAFLPSDLPEPFLLRRGTSCPNFLAFAHTSPTPPEPSKILIRDKPCTAGKLSTDTREDLLSRYLSGFPEVGQTITYLVTDALECPGITFQPGAVFTFVKSSADVTVDFSRVFQRNGTNVAADGLYTFVAGEETLVIGSNCLYTRFTKDEVDRQRGECFPGDAMVVTRTAVVPMEIVQTGDAIYDGSGWTNVIGWTHRDRWHTGWFVRVSTSVGSVTLSSGHYIYADGQLMQAADVTVGMAVPGGVVKDVRVVSGKGLYNLQTASGDVVVNGVRCSTYTRRVAPVMAHALLLPVRAVSWLGFDLLQMVGLGSL